MHERLFTYTSQGWRLRTQTVSLNRSGEAIAGANPSALSQVDRDLKVFVRQSASNLPVLVATSRTREIVLNAPNRSLATVWRAKVQTITWTDPDGGTEHGGLMLPKTFDAQHPPALVIQPYEYLPGVFLPDGGSTTADAAQPLVSRGMAVLFVNIPPIDRPSITGTSTEPKYFLKRLNAAIDVLSQQHLIDEHRIGIIGFSRAGFLTLYALSHDRSVHFAAAVVADATTQSYFEYMTAFFAGGFDISQEYDVMNGGFFWDHKDSWITSAPLFNANNIHTPVLFQELGPASYVGSFEEVAALSMNRVPFDVIYFASPTHQLASAQERNASMTATVNWMSCWLKSQQRAARDFSVCVVSHRQM